MIKRAWDLAGGINWSVQQFLPIHALVHVVITTVIIRLDYIHNSIVTVSMYVLFLLPITWLVSLVTYEPMRTKTIIRQKTVYGSHLMRDTTQMLVYQWASIMATELNRIPCTQRFNEFECRVASLTIAFTRAMFAVLSMWYTSQFMQNRKVTPLYVLVCTVVTEIYIVATFFVTTAATSVTTRPMYAVMVLFMAPMLNWLRRLSWDVYCTVCTKYHVCGMPLLIPSPRAVVLMSLYKIDPRQIRPIGWPVKAILSFLMLWCSLYMVQIRESDWQIFSYMYPSWCGTNRTDTVDIICSRIPNIF